MKLQSSFLLAFLLINQIFCLAQEPVKPGSAEIYKAIKKLQVLGSVLYVAAHPDDENTRMISYFSNEKNMHTTYLSMTRGDGGQNLIGPEIREELGVIRTQELLAARRIDGGNQMFTRANDFGYSKHPDETLKIWDKEKVLADVIWAIRKQRPDIIINRFNHRDPGSNHGHHTSSAMLSIEAFDLTNDETVYPEQLEYVAPWQASRVLFNTHWWFYGSQENFDKADKSALVKIDGGTYMPLIGKSNGEIAAASRSMHKSQGFGSTGDRGSNLEYLELLKGKMPEDDSNPLEGINTTWSRIAGGEAIGQKLKTIDQAFDFNDPSNILPELLDLYQMIENIPNDGFWVPKKKKELKDIIYWCSGLFLEVKAEKKYAVPGNDITFQVEGISRLSDDVVLERISFPISKFDTLVSLPLKKNDQNQLEFQMPLPANSSYTNVYWLEKEGSLGMYRVDDQRLIGLPESDASIIADVTIKIHEQEFQYQIPMVYKTNDRVKGEVYEPFTILPPLSIDLKQDLQMFESIADKPVEFTVVANDSINGRIQIVQPAGWTIEPSSFEVMLNSGNEVSYTISITPPEESDETSLEFKYYPEEGKTIDLVQVNHIKYDHIPTQTILKPAKVKLVKLDLKKFGENIGYIMGAGDEIPSYLEAIGYKVTLLEEDNMDVNQLSHFDAIVAGIRAYNTIDRIPFYQDALMEYVKQGGTYIVQYNTNRGLITEDIGPYPFQISRDRVTVEEAKIDILEPEHPIFNFPNKISAKDFDGWVQERGLYFANEWDDRYTPLISSQDPGEDPSQGAILVANYGKGSFIYTGISWFRQFPAAVPGSFRIFSNMLSLSQSQKIEP